MGEVYRATDTRLDRTVAIKVLPEHLADRADLRERFEREAKAVSSLNHPHICTLHDIGEQDGIHYLVMEYVDGDTLQQRLEKGRLPLDQALEYAIQIADALDKAHRQGVVHRDLKPGNIMITKSGTKLLDFGLAKLKGDGAEVSPLSQMPTQDASAPLTAEGTILGTLQYMAPEQLEGKEADARTDLFAFGAVVYEMVTGKKAFEGASQASLVGAIMNSQPQSMSALEAMTPPAFDYLVRTALAKDPDDRWQTAHDLMGQIKWIVEGGTQVGIPAPVSVQRRKKDRLAWSMTALLALSTLGFGILSLALLNVEPPSTTRLSVTVPEEFPLAIGGTPKQSLAISPDGQRIVYKGRNPDGQNQLYSRFLDQLVVEALPGTEGASQLFFSPGGDWVAFFTRTGELKKLRLDGGSPVTIAAGIPNSLFSFGSWYKDETIVFAGGRGPLQQVSAEGGSPPTPLSTLDATEGETRHSYPMFIRETGDVLFTVISSDRADRVEVIRRDTLERFYMVDGRAATVTESGHLLFNNRESALMAVPFDAAGRRVTGPVQPLPESVAVDGLRGVFQLAASESGTIAYVPAFDLPRTLGWVDRTGVFAELGPVPPKSLLSGLSPEGDTALIDVLGRNEILLFDLLRGIPTPIHARETGMNRPRWHPDGQQITLGGRRISLWDIDSGTESDLIEEGNVGKRLGSWSSDGGTLAYTSFSPQENIYAVTPGEGEPQPVVATDAREFSPVISPDGEWIAYVSDQTGLVEVWVARFPDGTGQTLISDGGGDGPSGAGTGGNRSLRTEPRNPTA